MPPTATALPVQIVCVCAGCDRRSVGRTLPRDTIADAIRLGWMRFGPEWLCPECLEQPWEIDWEGHVE